MRSIKHVFFDLDHTLWDFEKNSELELLSIYSNYGLHQRGISLEKEFIKVYKQINEEFWEKYRTNKVTKETLRLMRFSRTLEYFGITDKYLANDISIDYTENCPKRTILIDGSIELLNYLQSSYTMHIITNGFEEVQSIKLINSKLDSYFDKIITSEAAGEKKPNPAIFNFALDLTGATIDNSIMIGDNLNTDIKGAIEIGMHSIYYNPKNKEHNFSLYGDVSHLLEIKSIL